MRLKNLATAAAPLYETVEGYIARGEVPGAITLIGRGDETEIRVFGSDRLGGAPLARDAIFRISSMTKPIVAAAALCLVEEGRVQLDEPVLAYLPELATRHVLRAPEAELDDTVPARRAIIVRDLLTNTMGFGSMLRAPGATPIQRAEEALELRTLGPPKPATPHSADAWMKRFATLPLMHQPGEAWMYHTSSTVLGILIERVSDRSLGAFLREKLFDPLGMKDTSFHVPADKLHRLVTCYQADASGKLLVHDGVTDSQWARPRALEDGGGALVSTVDDYAAFAGMIHDRGAFRKRRLLPAAIVEAMTADQLSPVVRRSACEFLGEARSWGFGLSIVTQPDEASPLAGRFGWDGGYGTSWYSDRGLNLTAILMTQRLLFPWSSGIENDFWQGVYRAARA